MPRLLLPLIAMLATIVAGLLLVRKAVPWGFIDLPDNRKVHTLPTPRTGGLAMVLGGGFVFVLSQSFGWLPRPGLPWQTWLAGLGFITVGALDDRFSFQPRQKFLVFLSLSALAAWPWILVLKTAGVPWLPQAWVTSPLFLVIAAIILTFWFMAVPNAVNIEDAINGYMGGFTIIVMFGLYLRGVDTRLALGALTGFLCLNWPRAKHFMGDAGSFGCGFLIAEGILRSGGLLHPFMALAFTAPISLDVAMGIVRRLRMHMSLFEADCATCPHHLLRLSQQSNTLATLILWANACVFACLAFRQGLGLILYALFFASALVVLNRRVFWPGAAPEPPMG